MSSLIPASSIARPGERIGRHVVERLLGTGGMGCVYRATAPNGEVVALKVMREELADNRELLRLFFREAQIGAQLRHPNIVRFRDFGIDTGRYYLGMDLVEGPSLWSWVRTPPRGEEVLPVFDQILAGLAHAHAHGVIHRDLKPDNILLDRDREGIVRAHLVDFGVAHLRDALSEEEEQSESIVGTPEYISPEQVVTGSSIGVPSDLYAVGVMLFEVLTGQLPFSGPSAAATVLAHLRDPLPPLELRYGFRAQGPLEEVVERLLAREPADRFRCAAEVRRALRACQVLDEADEQLQRPMFHSGLLGLEAHRPSAAPTRVDGAFESADPSSSAPISCGLFRIARPPFVDVRGELHDMRAFHAQQLSEQRPCVLFVEGPYGSGKTRLVDQLGATLEEQGIVRVWRAETAETGDVFEPLRLLLARHYTMRPLNPEDNAARQHEQLLRDGFTSPMELQLAAEILEGRTLGHEATVSSDAHWILAGRLLAQAARRHPILLILEDLHSNHGAALRSLHHLLDQANGVGHLTLALTWRSEHATPGTRLARRLERLRSRLDVPTLDIQLERLGIRDMQRFVQNAVAIPPRAAMRIADRAEGNPSQAISILHYLIERHGEHAFEDPAALDDALRALPDQLADSLVERLDAAWDHRDSGADALKILEILAFLGDRFSREMASALLELEGIEDPRQALSDALAAGVFGQLLRELDEHSFRFDNRSLRDALVRRAEAADQAQARHLRCANLKLRFSPNPDNDRLAEIAAHYNAAGEYDEALRLYESAARKHLRANRLLEALRELDGAIAAARADRDELKTELAELLLTRADICARLSRHAETAHCLAELDQLHRWTEEAEPPALLRVRAHLHALEGAADAARELLTEAIQRSVLQGHEREGIRCRYQLGQLEMAGGNIQAAETHLRGAIGAARQVGDEHLLSSAIVVLGQVAWIAGAWEEASDYATIAEALFLKQQNRQGAATCHLLRGNIFRYQGRPAEANHHLQRAREDYLTVGDRRGTMTATHCIGCVAEQLGQTSHARACFDQAIRGFEEIGDTPQAAIAQLRLARLEAEEGRWRAAAELMLSALGRDITGPIHELSYVEALIDLAKEALFASREPLARDLLTRAARKLDHTGHESFLHTAIDEIAWLLHQIDAGE